MKRIAIVFMLCSITLFASQKTLKATPFAEVAQNIGKGVPAFIELGSEHCHSCQIMGRLLYEAKLKHPTYPIYFIDVRKERQAAYRLKIQMIPTQIIVDKKGYEIYRHVGPMKPKQLENILNKYLN